MIRCVQVALLSALVVVGCDGAPERQRPPRKQEPQLTEMPKGARVVEPVGSTAPSARTTTKNCGTIVGDTATDQRRAESFCARFIVEPDIVTALFAQDSILTVKITRDAANYMMLDRITSEQVVKNWMRGWRAEIGRPSVTVTVEHGDVEIASGDTTLMSGDRVTIRAR